MSPSMKTFSLAVLLALALSLPVVSKAQTFDRLARLDTPPATVLASNATTAQIDFSSPPTVLADYEITDLSGALSLQITNPAPGRTRRVFIDTDGSARAISILTNGITSGVEVVYSFSANVNTNGSSAFTVTNRSWCEMKFNRKTNLLFVNFYHGR